MRTTKRGVGGSAIDAIGNTPIVSLDRQTRGIDGHILAKLEYLNPGLSKKDRIARQIIEDAEADGRLRPDQTVVELTSGNTGTGLAIVCAVKGYSFVAVMSRGNSPERARMMRALGADVVLVDQLPDSCPGEVSGGDLARVEEEARRITIDRGAFRADQFSLEGNRRAHYLHTGPEILAQTGGRFDAFCDFVGSGGSHDGRTSHPGWRLLDARSLAARSSPRRRLPAGGRRGGLRDRATPGEDRGCVRRNFDRSQRGGGHEAVGDSPGWCDHRRPRERLRPEVPEHGIVGRGIFRGRYCGTVKPVLAFLRSSARPAA
jgi:hypothetical protein